MYASLTLRPAGPTSPTLAVRIINRTRTTKRLWSALWRLWLFSVTIFAIAYSGSTRANEASFKQAMYDQAAAADPAPEGWPAPRVTPDEPAYHIRNHGRAQVRMSKAMWTRLWCIKRGCE